MLLAACAQQDASPPPPRPVRAVQVPADVAAAVIRLAARIEARHETTLAFEVGGRVSERLADVGDTVAAGAVLARIDDNDLRLRERDLRARLAASEAERADAATALRRATELRPKGFVSQAELDRATYRDQAAIANELPQARARVNAFPFGMPAPSSIEYRVTGPDKDLARQIAAELRGVLQDHPQASGIHYSWRGPVATVRAELDHARLAALGLSAQCLGESLDMLLSGRPVTQLRQGDETIDVMLRLTDDERTRLGYLPNLPVPLADGSSLPLGQLAQLQPALEEGVVTHYNRVPAIMVYTDLP